MLGIPNYDGSDGRAAPQTNAPPSPLLLQHPFLEEGKQTPPLETKFLTSYFTTSDFAVNSDL